MNNDERIYKVVRAGYESLSALLNEAIRNGRYGEDEIAKFDAYMLEFWGQIYSILDNNFISLPYETISEVNRYSDYCVYTLKKLSEIDSTITR